MSKRSELLKNTAVIALGQILTRCISFLLLPLYTAVLNTKEYGTLDLLSSTAMLLVPVVSLELHDSVFRFLIDHRTEPKQAQKVVFNALAIVSGSSLLYVLLSAAGGLLFEPDYIVYLTLIVLSGLSLALAGNTARGLGDNKTYAVASTVTGSLAVVLNVVFILLFKMGVKGMLLSSILSNLAGTVITLVKYRDYFAFRPAVLDKKLMRNMLAYSLPMIPNVLSWWIFNTSDRYIIAFFLGVAGNGIYAVANKFPAILVTFFNIFNLTTTESVSLHYQDEDRDSFISEVINTLSDFSLALIHGMIALLPFVLPIFVNAQYEQSFAQIPLLALAVYPNIRAALLGTIYVAEKKSARAALTSAAAAAINILVNLCLIQRIGLYAASLSTLAAYAGLMLFRAFDVRKYVDLKRDKKKTAAMLLLTLIIIAAYYSNLMIVQILGLLLVTAAHFFFNRAIIRKMFKAAAQRLGWA